MTDLFFINYYRQSCFQLKEDKKKNAWHNIVKNIGTHFTLVLTAYSNIVACAAVDRKRATVTFSLLGERCHVIPLEMEPIKLT